MEQEIKRICKGLKAHPKIVERAIFYLRKLNRKTSGRMSDVQTEMLKYLICVDLAFQYYNVPWNAAIANKFGFKSISYSKSFKDIETKLAAYVTHHNFCSFDRLCKKYKCMYLLQKCQRLLKSYQTKKLVNIPKVQQKYCNLSTVAHFAAVFFVATQKHSNKIIDETELCTLLRCEVKKFKKICADIRQLCFVSKRKREEMQEHSDQLKEAERDMYCDGNAKEFQNRNDRQYSEWRDKKVKQFINKAAASANKSNNSKDSSNTNQPDTNANTNTKANTNSNTSTTNTNDANADIISLDQNAPPTKRRKTMKVCPLFAKTAESAKRAKEKKERKRKQEQQELQQQTQLLQNMANADADIHLDVDADVDVDVEDRRQHLLAMAIDTHAKPSVGTIAVIETNASAATAKNKEPELGNNNDADDAKDADPGPQIADSADKESESERKMDSETESESAAPESQTQVRNAPAPAPAPARKCATSAAAMAAMKRYQSMNKKIEHSSTAT